MDHFSKVAFEGLQQNTFADSVGEIDLDQIMDNAMLSEADRERMILMMEQYLHQVYNTNPNIFDRIFQPLQTISKDARTKEISFYRLHPNFKPEWIYGKSLSIQSNDNRSMDDRDVTEYIKKAGRHDKEKILLMQTCSSRNIYTYQIYFIKRLFEVTSAFLLHPIDGPTDFLPLNQNADHYWVFKSTGVGKLCGLESEKIKSISNVDDLPGGLGLKEDWLAWKACMQEMHVLYPNEKDWTECGLDTESIKNGDQSLVSNTLKGYLNNLNRLMSCDALSTKPKDDDITLENFKQPRPPELTQKIPEVNVKSIDKKFTHHNGFVRKGRNYKTNNSEHINDDEPLQLSNETMKALREFALSKNILTPSYFDDEIDNEDEVVDHNIDLVEKVRQHFEVKDRETIYPMKFKSKDGSTTLEFSVVGLKKELGQILNSTGLTIWRASEHLCQYVIDNKEKFANKTVCELGAGLGLVSILLDQLHVAAKVVSTDGDVDTLELLKRNRSETGSSFDIQYLLWGSEYCPSPEDGIPFLEKYKTKFDIIIAADVIYEADQVKPLIQCVCRLLSEHGQFILAFARRNIPLDSVVAEAAVHGLICYIMEEDDKICKEIIFNCEVASHHTEPIVLLKKN